jgi:hypothetical protein
MTSLLNKRLLWVSALFLSLPLAFAQAPSGAVTFHFDRTTFPVWDFTGDYTLTQQFVGIGSVPVLSFPVHIAHDVNGRLRGEGSTQVTIGSDVVFANFSLKGNVSHGGNATRAVFSVHLSGRGVIGGAEKPFHASIKYNLRVDPDPSNPAALIPPLSGTPVSGSIGVSGLGSAKVVPGDDFAVALPAGTDGAWMVDMDIFSLKRLGGVATINVDNGVSGDGSVFDPTSRVLSAKLTGNYKPTMALSQVALSGYGDSRGTTLHINFYSGATTPSRVIGKVLGQTISQ